MRKYGMKNVYRNLRKEDRPMKKSEARPSPNLRDLIPVKIDDKTTAFVKPGTDIAKVIQRYTSRVVENSDFINPNLYIQ